MNESAAKRIRATLESVRTAAIAAVPRPERSRNAGGPPSALDRAIEAVSPGWAVKRAKARVVLAAAQYRAAAITGLRPDWVTFGANSGATAPSYERSTLVARARDANRNDPIASGATDTLKTNIVGSGLRPQSRIRAARLGVSEERADLLRRQAEAAFARFSPLASSDNRLSFDELQFLALGKIIEDGETLAIPTWANEAWRPYGRCVELIECDRLGSAAQYPHGIVCGARGEPKVYYIHKATPNAARAVEPAATPVEAFDSKGRPKVLHIFPTKRPGQLRGVPLFAPVLSYFKDMADYLEAEVVAARVAACLAVFITRNEQYGILGPGETSADTVTELSPGLIARMNVGESINVVDPKRPGDAFAPFIETVMRIIGVSIGLPYELLIKDFSKTNYSSARASLLEGRRMFSTWRHWFAGKFCQPIWELVLEEAYLRGDFDAPGFYENKIEYCRAMWIGGGWGWVDPVKEVEASRKAIDYGLSTLAEEAAAQGRDWEEVLDQRRREMLLETGVAMSATGTGIGAEREA